MILDFDKIVITNYTIQRDHIDDGVCNAQINFKFKIADIIDRNDPFALTFVNNPSSLLESEK